MSSVYFSGGGTCCVIGLYFIWPLGLPRLLDYTGIVIYLHNRRCSFVFTLCIFSVFWRSVTPHAFYFYFFCFCGSHFCVKAILTHWEHYVFTILFSPGRDRSDADWVWPVILLLVENVIVLLVQSFPLWQRLRVMPFSWLDRQLSDLFTSDKRET